MLYLVEVPKSIHFLESRLEEISEKANAINAVIGCFNELPIQALTRIGNFTYEHEDSSTGFVFHTEERFVELDSCQKTILEMINDISKDFLAILDVIKNEFAEVNLTMRAVTNQAPIEGAIPISRIKISEPKPLCGAKDAKAWENFIFDLG